MFEKYEEEPYLRLNPEKLAEFNLNSDLIKYLYPIILQ